MLIASSNLSQTFRFGENIAIFANKVLDLLGEESQLLGNKNVQTTFNETSANAYISRTNAGLLTSLVSLLGDNKKVSIVGGGRDLKKLLLDVAYLKRNQPARTPEFYGFKDWNEVLAFASEQEGFHLKSFINAVQTYGEEELIKMIEETQAEDQSDCILTTAHKSKGREWDSVELNLDFAGNWFSEGKILDPEPLHLFYVALTRCKTNLNASSKILNMEFTKSQRSYKSSPQINSVEKPKMPSFMKELD